MSDQNRGSSREVHSSVYFKTAHAPPGTESGRALPSELYVPFLLASRGLMSKISTPCIFPRISRRSRPVACSRSVGMVPGLAPSGRRSASQVISAAREERMSAKTRSHQIVARRRRAPGHICNRHPRRPMARRTALSGALREVCVLTVERLDLLGNLAGLGVSVGAAVD